MESRGSGWENENPTDKSRETAWSSAGESFIYSKVLDSQRRRGAGYSTEAQDGFQSHRDEGNGREFSAWVQLTSGQSPGGVPNNTDIVRLRQESAALYNTAGSRTTVPYICTVWAHKKSNSEDRLRRPSPVPRARLPTRSHSGFSDLGILKATPDRLSHPALGSGQQELARVTSGPFSPRGRPPPKEKRSPLLWATSAGRRGISVRVWVRDLWAGPKEE